MNLSIIFRKIFLSLLLGFFILFPTLALASTCAETYPNNTGQCVAQSAACPSDKRGIAQNTPDQQLCATDEKCCYKLAGNSPTELQSQDSKNLELQVPLFNYVQANNLVEYIATIYKFLMIVLVPLAIVAVIIGGVQWVMAAGNPTKIGAAKQRIITAFIGLGIGLCSYVLLSLVGITQLRLPSITYIQPLPDDTIDIENAPLEPDSGNTPATAGANPAGCPSDAELQKIDTSKLKITGATCDPRLRPNTLAKLYEAQDAAKKQGCTLGVNQAFRSFALQSHFYQCFLTKSCNGGNAAAPPSCHAPHMTGGAVDLSITCPGCANSGCGNKLNSIMFSVGWTHWSHEYWHFEYGTAEWSTHSGRDYP